MKQMNIRNIGKKMKQRGSLLVDASIAVVIIGAVLAISLVIVPRVLADNRGNAELSELPTIFSNSQKIYRNRASYNGLTLAQLIALNAFPPDRVTGAASAANRWGGAITVAAATITTADDAAAFTYAGVPEAECKAVAQGMESAVRQITVNGTVVKADGAALNLTTLGAQCAGGSNTIIYEIGK